MAFEKLPSNCRLLLNELLSTDNLTEYLCDRLKICFLERRSSWKARETKKVGICRYSMGRQSPVSCIYLKQGPNL